MATQLAEEAPQIDAANDEQSQPRDYEAEARAHGWTDAEEFKGDPARWVDAETFVKRADEVLPLLKKRDQANRREIDDLKKMVRRLVKSEQAAYTSALADLQARQDAAVEDGDTAANRALTKQIGELSEQIKADLPGDTVGGEDPAEQFEAFVDANLWYEKANLASASEQEVEARLFADRLMKKWAREGRDNEMKPSEFFAAVTREVEAEFPLLNKKAPRPKPQSDVAGVTRLQGASKARTGANLPPEAKQQATRFHAQGIYGKKTLSEALDAYAKSYDWS